MDIPVTIEGVPTLREADGLAMSSRNAYLNPEQRRAAAALPRLLDDVARGIAGGAPVAPALARAKGSLTGAGFTSIDYLTLADGTSLLPLDHAAPGARLFVAAWIGRTRLIDNIPVTRDGAT
jgi:pantoate--beta-alanine ligase